MAGLHIPALGRKFRLLIDYGFFKDLDDIAQRFGVKSNTLQWWCHGDGARPVDTMPDKHLETLQRIAGDCIGESLRPEEIRSFVFSSIGQWEEAFRSDVTISLSKLIETEAIKDCGRLFLKPPPEADLIETENTYLPEPEYSVPINTWFRLEVLSRTDSDNVIAVQNSGQDWGSVAAIFNKASNTIHLPGYLKDRQQFAHIRERQDIGLHRFIVFQTPEPPPMAYRRYLEDNIRLDGQVLNHLAAFYDAQNKSKRRLYLLNVEITSNASAT